MPLVHSCFTHHFPLAHCYDTGHIPLVKHYPLLCHTHRPYCISPLLFHRSYAMSHLSLQTGKFQAKPQWHVVECSQCWRVSFLISPPKWQCCTFKQVMWQAQDHRQPYVETDAMQWTGCVECPKLLCYYSYTCHRSYSLSPLLCHRSYSISPLLCHRFIFY